MHKRNPFLTCRISTSMTEFMKKKGEDRVLRMEVTQSVLDYIKSRGLSNLSKITPDDTLSLLLGTKGEVTFYNLEKYINKHYIK